MKVTIRLAVVIALLASTFCNYCSWETCRRCCQVTPTGCMNSNDYRLRGRFISYLNFCQDCDCDDPGQGCGWKANNFGRVECTSCDNLRTMNGANNVVIAGCGHVAYNGDIVYTTLPNPFGP